MRSKLAVLPIRQPSKESHQVRRAFQVATSERQSGKITELISSYGDMDALSSLLPMLAQLSWQDRWFVWVAPPEKLPRELLSQAGIDLNKVILLPGGEAIETLQLARKALASGTCHVVVSWQGLLTEHTLASLERAAGAGRSHGIVLSQRQRH